jgi:hypothetical protein
VKIYGVDEQPAGKISEGDITYETGDQCLERLTAIEGRSKEPSERDVGSGDLKHIPPADQAGAGIHLPHRYSRGPSGTDERPDAGADNQIGNQAPLLEGPEHTDVGKPF